MSGLTSSLVVVAALAFGATQAHAVDITECGQVVDDKPRRVVNLVADLDCSDPNQYDHHAISLWRGGTLNLNGFSLIGPAGPSGHTVGVVCWFSCRINGPGTIEGFQLGIETKYGPVRVTDVSITGAWHSGIDSETGTKGVRLQNATVTGTGLDGINAIRLVARDSVIIGNGIYCPTCSDVKVSKRARLVRTTFGTCSGKCRSRP